MSGKCAWPGDSWPHCSQPNGLVIDRLQNLPFRAIQIDVDTRAGNPRGDIEWLMSKFEERTREIHLPGLEMGQVIDVCVREWDWSNGSATMELWWVKGPLHDWAYWKKFGGDNHCIWYRVYPFDEWGLADFFLRHSVPERRQWQFDSAPMMLDTTEEKARMELQWKQEQESKNQKKQESSKPHAAREQRWQ